LNHLIAAAEAKLTEAIETAAKEVSALPESPVSDDDDMPLQPLDMMYDAFVDTAGDRERIERRLVTPAQRFTFDSYDIALDISKGSDRLEAIYQSVAQRAFKFCKVHGRKSDFRRLCEQRLRKDLANATKYAHQSHSINLGDAETLNRHLDTRFLQLETAVELELWQEAFRSVEDVHGLVAGKKSAKPSMMATYYEKLTQIFKAEGGKQTAVFHAAAWARYFQYAERAGSVPERAPGCVLLSALAVPLGEVESKQRLIALLNLSKMPSRTDLVKDAATKHLRRVPAPIQELYRIIELDFQPLKACAALKPIISALGPEYQPYLPALREVVLSRLLQELSQVYDDVALSHVLDLVKPFQGTSWETDMPSLEQFIMNASRRGDVAATIDHSTKAISFAAPAAPADRLSQLAICLHNTIQYLNPKPVASRAEKFAYAIAQAEEERKMVAQRRQIVAKRRELLEESTLRREKEESTAKAERAKALAEETQRQQKQAAAAAERDQIQRQMDQAKRDEARKLAEQLSAQGGFKVDMSKIDELDSDKLLNLHIEQLAKEKKDLGEKLRLVGKRYDHLERAYRKEERTLLADDYERQKTQDKESHEALIKSSREDAIAKNRYERELKTRLARMMPDYVVARQAVASKQEQEFQESKAQAQKIIAEEKAKFKEQLLEKKLAEKKKREESRRKQEEEERRRAGEFRVYLHLNQADNLQRRKMLVLQRRLQGRRRKLLKRPRSSPVNEKQTPRLPKLEPNERQRELLIWSESESSRSEKRKLPTGESRNEVEVELDSVDPNHLPLRLRHPHLLVHHRSFPPKLVDGETNWLPSKLVVHPPLLLPVDLLLLAHPLRPLPLPPPRLTSRLLPPKGVRNGNEVWVDEVEEELEVHQVREVVLLEVLEEEAGGSFGFYSFIDIAACDAQSHIPISTK
jgi:translation initiation factor 3 subunit A